MLQGQFTRLRTLDRTDAEWMRGLRNSSAVMEGFQYRIPISDIQQEAFVRGLSESRDQIYFVAEDPVSAKPFGICSLQRIDYRNQRAESGIFWDAEAAGGSIAAFEAAFLMSDFAYSYLNLHKLFAELLPDNRRAIRFNEALGMTLEGTRRRHVFYNGRFHDLLLYAQFRDDFYEQPSQVIQTFLSMKLRKDVPSSVENQANVSTDRKA
jgi:RimJ/RimL family protein N-acetyltransferase